MKKNGRITCVPCRERSCVGLAIVHALKRRKLHSKNGWIARIPMKETRKQLTLFPMFYFLCLKKEDNRNFVVNSILTASQINTSARYSNGALKKNGNSVCSVLSISRHPANKAKELTCWKHWPDVQKMLKRFKNCWTLPFWSKTAISPKMISSSYSACCREDPVAIPPCSIS